MMKRKTILQLSMLSALVLITIVGTAHAAFADCTDCCDEGYTDSYRCVGRERQRLWEFSDCTREWRTIETCSYDCEDGSCSECAPLRVEVSPSRPSDRFEEETVYTTIKIRNLDDRGDWFNLKVYLCEAGRDCRSCESSCETECDTCHESCYDYCDCDNDDCDNDDTFARNCREMRCDDTNVYVSGGGRKYVKCSRFVKNAGDYRIKVVFWADSYNTRRTVYSDVFEVRDECSAGAEGDYRCFGKYRQQKYIDEDCDVRWKIVEYCPYGCESAACVQPTVLPKTGEPEIFMRTRYEMEKCKLSRFTFTVRNSGETDTFSIETGGDVADWIETLPSVSVEKGETKVITAYASVPCSASAGEHEFTITASSKTTDSRVGVIRIPDEQGLFTTDFANYLAMVVIIFVVFVAAFAVFKSGWFRLDRLTFGPRARPESGPEQFKTRQAPEM